GPPGPPFQGVSGDDPGTLCPTLSSTGQAELAQPAPTISAARSIAGRYARSIAFDAPAGRIIASTSDRKRIALAKYWPRSWPPSSAETRSVPAPSQTMASPLTSPVASGGG